MKHSVLRTAAIATVALLFSACVMLPPGQHKKETAPGQVMHKTGCNPASGKCKDK